LTENPRPAISGQA